MQKNYLNTLYYKLFLLGLALVSPLNAATDGVWDNTVFTGNWNDPANWVGGDIPNAFGDTATFPDIGIPATHYTITLDIAVTLGTLTCDNKGSTAFDGPGPLAINSSLVVNNATNLAGPNFGFGLPLYLTNDLEIHLSGTDSNTVAVSGAFPQNPVAGIRFIGPGGIQLNDAINVTTLSLDNASLYVYFPQSFPTTISMSNSATIEPGLEGVPEDSITVDSAIIGNGRVLMNEPGTLTLSGACSYTGGTTITAGNVTFSGTPPSTGNISVAGGSTLTVSNAAVASIGGNISGAGAFVKSGAGNLTLSGNNSSHTGSKTVAAGTLTGTTSSLTGNIANSAALVFSQAGNGTYSGVISSTGTLTKLGAGTVTFSGTNTYTGDTEINAGTLSVTGSIANSNLTTVSNGATLTGNGTVGDLTNEGRVHPGLTSAQTLSVNGTYTQDAGATLKSRLTPSSASKLTVTGDANLDGTLELQLSSGAYASGTSFTILDANSITGDFATFTDGDPTNVWVKTVDDAQGTVVISLPSSIVRTPVPLSSLRGNARAVGDYMYGDGDFVNSNSDLLALSNAMLALPAGEFEESLIRVSPLATAANPMVTFQSDLQMAVVLDKQFQKKQKAARKKRTTKRASRAKNSILEAPCSAIPNTGLFIEPIGVFYHQRSVDGDLVADGQAAFQSYTYGAGLGWEQVLDDQFVVEGGVGYTHSNLVWKDNFGNSKWSTLYVAPFFGWFNQRGFANIMVMGAFNFFNTDRRILFPGIERVAESRYTSYDILVRANGGGLVPLGKEFWFQPEATLNYLTIFTEKYTETGAGSANLENQANVNYILQPSFRAKFVKEFFSRTFCYAPNLYVGWLANVLLKSQTLSARFRNAPNQIFYTIEGYYKTTNQLILGCELYAEKLKMFNYSINFEADILSKFEVYTAKLKFEWMF